MPLKPDPPPKPVIFEFKFGHSYSIYSNGKNSHNYNWLSPECGTFCVFRYEGKRGIHHIFKEVKGGWTRTYTDAQLIGKHIKEVEE